VALAHSAKPIACAKPVVEVLAVEVSQRVEQADVKRLEAMRRVWWIGHEQNPVLITELNETKVEMTTVAI
jgi:hypothetical protein